MKNRQPQFVFILAVFCVVYPVLTLYYGRGISAVFQYFAGDAWYYMTIARNFASSGTFTFDGIYPTNGFHPLWQYILSIAFSMLQLHGQTEQILFAFFTTLTLVSVGSGFFALVIFKLTERIWLALLASVPGIYFLLFSHIDVHYGSTWSFINGMESGLSILFFGLFLYFLICRDFLKEISVRTVVCCSLITTLVSLSRLDDIFLFAPFILYLFFNDQKKNRNFYVFLYCLIPLVLIGGYIFYNYTYSGLLLPVSGSVKSGKGFMMNYLPVLNLFYSPQLFFKETKHIIWQQETWRVLQMIVPLLLAAVWLAFHKRYRFAGSTYYENIIAVLCWYVVLKGGYNFMRVGIWSQGHWYYPLSIMIANLIMAISVNSLVRKDTKYSLKTKVLSVIGAVSWIIISGNSTNNYKIISHYNMKFFSFWKERVEITNELQPILKNKGIVEVDDGIIAYSLPVHVMSGFGLALDKKAVPALKSSKLLDLAYQRGFSFISTVDYTFIPDDAEINPEALHKSISEFLLTAGHSTEKWKFSVAYRHPATNWMLIRFEPK